MAPCYEVEYKFFRKYVEKWVSYAVDIEKKDGNLLLNDIKSVFIHLDHHKKRKPREKVKQDNKECSDG